MGEPGGQVEPAVTPAGGISTIPADLVELLDLLAGTIVETLGFGVAVVNLARADGSFHVVSVAGDADAREALLGQVDPPGSWDRVLAASEAWGRLRYSDHRAAETIDALTWIPEFTPLDDPEAWHPEDALFAPLVTEDGRVIGVLSVDLPDGGVRPGAVACRGLEAFAVSAALAIDHATMRSRAEEAELRYRELAMQDPLTRLGNRHRLLERLNHALTGRPEANGELALVFVDLDGFKLVNDRHSHEVGDHVLREVADRLRTTVRSHDTVARWGGDEFVLLLEHLRDREAGVDLARRVHEVVGRPIGFDGGEAVVHASVGMAFRGEGATHTAEGLIRAADAAMYRAKRAGGGVDVTPRVDPSVPRR